VLPEPEYAPSGGSQAFVRISIAFYVSEDLFTPPNRVRFGPSSMLGTSMPKATIDENGDSGAYECEIGPASCVGKGPIHAKAKAELV
jgi:hypothetical protein